MRKETYFIIAINTVGLSVALFAGDWLNSTNGMISAGFGYIITMLVIGRFEKYK